MNCSAAKLCFNDHLDKDLSPDQRDQLEDHLRHCVGCRRDFSALESLVNQARQLPAERSPERDLWPGIANRIDESRQGEVPPVPMAETWIRLTSLAAGLVLFLTLAFVLWPLDSRREAPESASNRGNIGATTATLGIPAASTDLDLLRTDFRLVVERQKEKLTPETLAVVERNMRVIDDAIEEINLALEKDPNNRHLNLLLAAQMQREADLVNQINTI